MLDVQIIICFCGVCPRLEGFCRAKSVICGQGERHRNNILYKLKYGRGANCERSHYMKTAGRKCFATAENLQVQSDHQTVTLHLACRLRSADRYLHYRKGWIRCHAFVCSLSLFFPFFFSVPLHRKKKLTFVFLIPFPFSSLNPSKTFLASSLVHLVFLPTSATFPHHISVACSSLLPPLLSNMLIPAPVTLFLSLFVVSHT